MRIAAAFLAAAAVAQAQLPLVESAFEKTAPAWRAWAQRDEIAPKMWVDGRHSRGGEGALAISGAGNPASSGGWQREAGPVEPGRRYRLTAWYRAEGLTEEANQILCRLGWVNEKGQKTGQPEFAWEVTTEGAWKRLTVAAPAPERSTRAFVQLWLHNAPGATVWWDDIRLEQIEPPAPRRVNIASVRLRPSRSTGPEENVRLFSEVVRKQAPAPTDLIVFPEGMTVVGTSKKYVDIAESVPGPTTKALGELAKERKSWIVAGLYERDGLAVYNTAVLVDREGRVAGRYRKVYLPREEVEAGLTPGKDFPVFRTDFGRVGLMICWDVQYADPARALALNGAEIVVLPIWGGNLTLTKARAIENSVFLVTSGYDIPSLILDPHGETLAATETNGAVALATVDLNRRYPWEWLGDMRGRFMRELRLDVPAKRPDVLP